MKYLLLLFVLFLVGCGGSSSDSNVRSETPIDPPIDPEDPPDIPVGAIELPAHWGFYGDSHTAGREDISSSSSPSVVFRNIWEASDLPTPSRVLRDGVGGRALARTRVAFDGDTYADTPWIHAQESGDQNNDGQRTPEEFGDTFEAFWRAVDDRYPGSLKTYETAHSFLLLGVDDRDWQTTQNWADWGYARQADATSYNDEMLNRIELLADDDIVVIPVYTAEYIDALIARIPGGYPSIEMVSDPRHYNGVGNFMIALAKFKALGYDVNALDFSSVTIHSDPVTDAAHKRLCVDIINTVSMP